MRGREIEVLGVVYLNDCNYKLLNNHNIVTGHAEVNDCLMGKRYKYEVLDKQSWMNVFIGYYNISQELIKSNYINNGKILIEIDAIKGDNNEDVVKLKFVLHRDKLLFIYDIFEGGV